MGRRNKTSGARAVAIKYWKDIYRYRLIFVDIFYMTFIDNIRNKPRAEKIKIIWAAAALTALLLIAVWIISYKYRKNLPKDTSLFRTIDKGIKDVKENYKK